jgi:hypothetical protein
VNVSGWGRRLVSEKGDRLRGLVRSGVLVATRVTGRYGAGTLDRLLYGLVVIGAPLRETPAPRRVVGNDNASGPSGPQIERGRRHRGPPRRPWSC